MARYKSLPFLDVISFRHEKAKVPTTHIAHIKGRGCIVASPYEGRNEALAAPSSQLCQLLAL